MIALTREQQLDVASWFEPERPGLELSAAHVRHTGHGALHADRWPRPRLLLSQAADNYTLRGDPAGIDPVRFCRDIHGFVAAEPGLLRWLQDGVGEVLRWPRVLLALDPEAPLPSSGNARRLTAADAAAMGALTVESSWVHDTWGGPTGLVTSGLAWGSFAAGRLVAVTAVWFVGRRCAELAVVTEPGFRGLGLAVGTTAGLCAELRRRGLRPTWSTSDDNQASIRVALKSGFAPVGTSVLYAVRTPLPAPAQRD